MKKVYSKPEIAFESFVLSTNIAGNCDMIVGNPSKDACGIVGSDGTTLFTAKACDFDWQSLKGDDYDGFCYHNPSEKTNMFNS